MITRALGFNGAEVFTSDESVPQKYQKKTKPANGFFEYPGSDGFQTGHIWSMPAQNSLGFRYIAIARTLPYTVANFWFSRQEEETPCLWIFLPFIT